MIGYSSPDGALFRRFWARSDRERVGADARLELLSAQGRVEQFDSDVAGPVVLPDWVPTFIIKCVGSAVDVLEGLPDVAPAPVKRLRQQVTKKMREGSYEFTPEQLMQAHLAYDRREAEKFPPQRVDYGK